MSVPLAGVLNELFLPVAGVAVKEICELLFLDCPGNSKVSAAAAMPNAGKLSAFGVVIIAREELVIVAPVAADGLGD